LARLERNASGVVGFVVALGAVAAVVVPLESGQLRYPVWFAAQRAAAILGPVLAGLYWRRHRPGSRFGTMLVVLGLLGIPLVLQAVRSPWAYFVGQAAEAPLLYATFVVILAFPTGRLVSRAERAILLGVVIMYVMWWVASWLFTPQVVGSPLSICRAACPANPLYLASHPDFLRTWLYLANAVAVTVAVASALVIGVRLARADPPRRRALWIGSAVAVTFLVAFAINVFNFGPALTVPVPTTVWRWVPVVFRTALPLGYIAALIDAQLYAGRVVGGVLDRALDSSRAEDITRSLPAALGEPNLRFGFWVPGRGWTGHDGEPFEMPTPESGEVVRTIERAGHPFAVAVHRSRLEESPELIRAIVATSLLLFENETLEVEVRSAIRDLEESRARVVKAGDSERRRIERDLHDGAQQRLLALGIKLHAVGETMGLEVPARQEITDLCIEVDRALAEIRDLAHGIFPAPLTDLGLLPALRAAVRSSPLSVKLDSDLVDRRYPAELETALYFSCAEALQNISKHAGAGADATIGLAETDGAVLLSVRDTGRGFDPSQVEEGTGLSGIRDRLGALGGRLEIRSRPGRGTIINCWVPVAAAPESTSRPQP